MSGSLKEFYLYYLRAPVMVGLAYLFPCTRRGLRARGLIAASPEPPGIMPYGVLSAGEPSVGQFSSVMFNVKEGDDDDDQD